MVSGWNRPRHHGKAVGAWDSQRARACSTAHMAEERVTAGQPKLPPLADLGQVYALEKHRVR